VCVYVCVCGLPVPFCVRTTTSCWHDVYTHILFGDSLDVFTQQVGGCQQQQLSSNEYIDAQFALCMPLAYAVDSTSYWSNCVLMDTRSTQECTRVFHHYPSFSPSFFRSTVFFKSWIWIQISNAWSFVSLSCYFLLLSRNSCSTKDPLADFISMRVGIPVCLYVCVNVVWKVLWLGNRERFSPLSFSRARAGACSFPCSLSLFLYLVLTLPRFPSFYVVLSHSICHSQNSVECVRESQTVTGTTPTAQYREIEEPTPTSFCLCVIF